MKIRIFVAYLAMFFACKSEAAPRIIQEGTSGEDVKKLQRYLGLDPSGTARKQTVAAIKAFQKKHGLPQTGKWAEMSEMKKKELAQKKSTPKKKTVTSSKPKPSLKKPAVEAIPVIEPPLPQPNGKKAPEKKKEPRGVTRDPIQIAREEKRSWWQRMFGSRNKKAEGFRVADARPGKVKKTYASNFGYRDRDDNGRGSPYLGYAVGHGKCTNNTKVIGVALPEHELCRELGVPPLPRRSDYRTKKAWDDAVLRAWHAWEPARDCTVDFVDVKTGRTLVRKVDVVDLGPARWVIRSRGVGIDLTHKLNRMLGGDGHTLVAYRINKPARRPVFPTQNLNSGVRLASR